MNPETEGTERLGRSSYPLFIDDRTKIVVSSYAAAASEAGVVHEPCGVTTRMTCADVRYDLPSEGERIPLCLFIPMLAGLECDCRVTDHNGEEQPLLKLPEGIESLIKDTFASEQQQEHESMYGLDEGVVFNYKFESQPKFSNRESVDWEKFRQSFPLLTS